MYETQTFNDDKVFFKHLGHLINIESNVGVLNKVG